QLNFCSIITVDEKMSYTQHPQDANKTVLQQESVVNVRGVPLSSYIEHFVIDNIAKNADKGRQAIEIVMAKIKQESVELQHSAKQRLEALNHMTFPDPTSF
ncbi:PLD3B-like protein, partial [Mya arenaria]